jgi:hypothetical protein
MRVRPGERWGMFGTINGGSPDAQYVCASCDYRWPVADVYCRWPIRLKWGAGMSSAWFSWHGWEIGTDRLWRRVFGWTFHLGRLKVIFGPDWRKRPPLKRRACPRCDATAWEVVS